MDRPKSGPTDQDFAYQFDGMAPHGVVSFDPRGYGRPTSGHARCEIQGAQTFLGGSQQIVWFLRRFRFVGLLCRRFLVVGIPFHPQVKHFQQGISLDSPEFWGSGLERMEGAQGICSF